MCICTSAGPTCTHTRAKVVDVFKYPSEACGLSCEDKGSGGHPFSTVWVITNPQHLCNTIPTVE